MDSVKNHLQSFVFATVIWIVFWLLGWPDYYQQYSTRFMILGMSISFVPLSLSCLWMIKRLGTQKYLHAAFLLAFYTSIPLAIYDGLYCGVYLGFGWAFLKQFWYLTVYYALSWIALIPLGFWLDAKKQ